MHYRKSKKKKNHQCQLCGKVFQDEHSLKLHCEGQHLKSNELKCDHPGCPYTSYYPANMKSHKAIVHDQIKNYNCELCEAKFYYEYKLKQHVETTHGSTKYVCETCAKSYNRKDRLNAHVKKNHAAPNFEI